MCAVGQRYVVQDDGNVLCAWVDSVDQQRLRLATIRWSSLPLIEDGGTLNGLNRTANQELYGLLAFQRGVIFGRSLQLGRPA